MKYDEQGRMHGWWVINKIQYHYEHGVLSNKDGPAIITANVKFYWENGIFIRADPEQTIKSKDDFEL